ncbi:S41 family peptidase [Candidatus Latescibacterota bacterium]
MKKTYIRYIFALTLFFISITEFSDDAFCEELTSLEKALVQEKILSNVRKSYVDTTLEVNTLYDGAIQGMIDKLDPHSSYMPPKRASDFTEKIRGGFEGVGISFAIIDNQITLIQVIEGGPSEAAGLKSRDRIVRIDGKDVLGISNEEVKNLLRGSQNSKVSVHVERPGEDELLEFSIIRDKIKLNSVSHAYMLDRETGYLAITNFTTKTNFDVGRSLKKLKDQGMQKLVLDLRNNSGGSLEASMHVVDDFISDGLIVETRGTREKGENRKWSASGFAEYIDIPMILMINHGSASASEIVAGALQDHDRALIVGQTSFGKGLVMRPITIASKSGKNLGSLMLSVAHYYTPSGRLIQRPYTNGREEYIKEGFDDIDPNAVDLMNEDKPVFYTDLGREVYGGGGITPDRKIDPLPRLNMLESALKRTNLFFEFADRYLLLHDNIPEDFNEFLIQYRIPREELELFKQFTVEKGIHVENDKTFDDELKDLVRKYDYSEESIEIIKKTLEEENNGLNEKLFDKSLHFIEREIKQEIARMKWGSEERYKVWHTDDKELKEALVYFDEAEELLKKRIAMGDLNIESSTEK